MKEETLKTNNLLQKLENMHTYEAILATDNTFKNALLLVSLFINVAILVTWMVVQLA